MSLCTLPLPARRAELVVFWIALSVVGGAGAEAVVRLLGGQPWLAAPAAVALAASLPLARRSLPLRLYRLWNRLARRYADLAAEVVTWLCFFIVVVAVGRAGSALAVRSPGTARSTWTNRRTLSSELYDSQDDSAAGRGASGGLGPLAAWALHSGRLWVLSLLPFLLVLRMLARDGPEDEGAVPSIIYTLY